MQSLKVRLWVHVGVVALNFRVKTSSFNPVAVVVRDGIFHASPPQDVFSNPNRSLAAIAFSAASQSPLRLVESNASMVAFLCSQGVKLLRGSVTKKVGCCYRG